MIVIAELVRQGDEKNGANITVRGVEPKRSRCARS
jgi:hypothetical protein